MKNKHYETLGVPLDATQEEIKKSYRDKSKELHPDVNNGDDKGFAELAKAYEVLSDPERRKKYDETGTDKKISEQEEVSAIIVMLTMQFLGKNLDPKTNSLVDYIKDSSKTMLRGLEESIESFKRSIEQDTHAANRIVRKEEGHNFILAIIQNKIESSKKEIQKRKEAISAYEKVYDEIVKYSYLVDNKPVPNGRIINHPIFDFPY